MVQVLNETKGNTVASDVRIARSMWARFWGLMGKKPLADGRALLIEPCSSVHTWFMRFRMDGIFMDRENRVVKIVSDMKPWRMAMGGKGAHSVLEMTGGSAERVGVEVGDRLAFSEPAGPEPTVPLSG